MTGKIYLVALLAAAFTGYAYAQENTVEDNEKHYSFVLPQGWTEMSQEAVKEFANPGASDLPGYDDIMEGFTVRGFTQGNAGTNFMLLMEYKLKTPANLLNDEIVNGFTAGIKKGAGQNGVTNIVVGEARMDKERNRCTLSAEMEVLNVKLEIDVAFLLGLNDLVIMAYYYPVDDDKQAGQTQFNTITDSFRYNQGYVYDQSKVDGLKYKKIGIFAGVVIGVLLSIGAVVYFARPRKQAQFQAAVRRPFNTRRPFTAGQPQGIRRPLQQRPGSQLPPRIQPGANFNAGNIPVRRPPAKPAQPYEEPLYEETPPYEEPQQ